MQTVDKRQFLDPISTISRIILLHFSPPNTKLRILDHTVQLVEDNVTEKIYRKVYGDTRGDICVLYPIFIRYIELYLMEKHKKIDTRYNNQNNSYNIDSVKESQLTPEELTYKNLKKLGEYAIFGLHELQKTYNYDNSVFALQYYILLIRSGINREYEENLLPAHLKELTKNNLLDDSKVQKIWGDLHIIELGKTFEKCFEASKNNDSIMLEVEKNKILNLLNEHDKMFKKMLGTDIVT